MQIPSTNSGHDQSSHQITECIHPHSYRHERTGASASSMTKTQDPQQLLQEASKEEGFSLSAWMKKMMGGGKSILGAIWGGGSDSASSTPDGLSQGGEEQVMAQIGNPDAADHGQNTHRSAGSAICTQRPDCCGIYYGQNTNTTGNFLFFHTITGRKRTESLGEG